MRRPAMRRKTPVVVRGLSSLDLSGLGRVFAEEELAIRGGEGFGRSGHGLVNGVGTAETDRSLGEEEPLMDADDR